MVSFVEIAITILWGYMKKRLPFEVTPRRRKCIKRWNFHFSPKRSQADIDMIQLFSEPMLKARKK